MSGETLRALLAASRRSPRDVAGRSGIGLSTLYTYLSGESVPKPWRVPALAQALGVSRVRVERAIEATRVSR